MTLYGLGDSNKGDELMYHSLWIYISIGDFLSVVEVHNHHGLLYLKSERPKPARGRFHEALDKMVMEGIDSLLEEARAHEGIGLCDEKDGRRNEAIKYLRKAKYNYSKIGADQDRKRVAETLDELRHQAEE